MPQNMPDTKPANSSLGLSGFTLIEVMIVLVVIGVIAGLVTPAFIGFLGNARIDKTAEALSSTIRLTRGAARASSQQAVICASKDADLCRTNQKKWNDGWVAFLDCDDNHIRRITVSPPPAQCPNEPILRAQGSTGVTLIPQIKSVPTALKLHFDARGQISNIPDDAETIRFGVTNDKAAKKLTLKVDKYARIEIQ